MSTSTPQRPPGTFALILIATLLVAVGLYLMRPVVLPLILAVFFSALARPLQVRLQRFMPSSLALVLTIVVSAAILVSLPLVFAANMQSVIAKLPEYGPRLQEIIGDGLGLLKDAGLDVATIDLQSQKTTDVIIGVATSAAGGIFDFLGQVVLVIFLMVFLLAEANILRAKLAIALKPTDHATVMESFASMQERIQQYVQTKTLFSALNATAAGVFTWVLGMDFPVIWGLLTFILYFIPTFGTLIATIPPVLLALVQFESPTTAIVCLIGLIVIFNLLGNVVEPRFLGRTLSLSPLVVFVSLIFWGWFFDVVGFVLSVPLTVVLGIICEHIPSLRPIAVLIADKPRPRTEDQGDDVGERAR
ncbi:MAG: AI-2E family transporter [Deltaproteobacteria bacterium]|nr:AI-2E family transporter [Deltaproteobacteria bacterium]